MFYDDHNPPHLHARYGEFEILINITDLSVFAGQFPPRAFGLLMEWTSLHNDELLVNWNLAKELKPLNPIAPLV